MSISKESSSTVRGVRAALEPILASAGDDPFAEGTVGEAFDDGQGVMAGTGGKSGAGATDGENGNADGTGGSSFDSGNADEEENEYDPERDNRLLFNLTMGNTGDGEAMTKTYHLPLTQIPIVVTGTPP